MDGNNTAEVDVRVQPASAGLRTVKELIPSCVDYRISKLIRSFIRSKFAHSAATVLLVGCMAAAMLLHSKLRHPRFGRSTGDPGTGILPSTDLVVLETPRQLPPLAPALWVGNSVPSIKINALLSHSPRVPLNGSVICHLLRLYGLHSIPDSRVPSGSYALQLILDDRLAERQLGASLLSETPSGVRFTISAEDRPVALAGEAHRDQCLAAIGELGIACSTPIQTPSGSACVRDLLQDSIATFDIHEREIAWTAIACCMYMKADAAWRNRDGDTFTLNALTKEVLRRPLDQASCGGIHLLAALTLLTRVDSDTHCLEASTRVALVQRLREAVKGAVASQSKEGWWTLGWDKPTKARSAALLTPFFEMLVTGHMLEWLEYLPRELQPDVAVYRRAALWLEPTVSALSMEQFPRQMLCPRTHAVCALRNLIGKAS